MKPETVTKDSVREYWNLQPCDAEDWQSEPRSLAYFEKIAQRRYVTHPYIDKFADFARWKGRRVLEIGVGAGSDFCRWIAAGAKGVGVDLTQTGVELTRQNLALRRLCAPVIEADAENLPFDDGDFDLCYSFGVIHHTPNMPKAIAEIRRVLKPGGEIRIMLYHTRSWVTWRTYLEHGVLRGNFLASSEALLARHKESPGTKAFTRSEVAALFQDFDDVRVQPQLTTYDYWEEVKRQGIYWRCVHSLWPSTLVRLAGDRFGWNLLISGIRR